jgi:BirA family biotin operon repressor/biotin-[acetyl-CoA-carboxylase] ligase
MWKFAKMNSKEKSNSSLHAQTLFIGQNYMFLPVTPSTNTYLKHLNAANNLPEGTVVSTGYQSEGRGQAGTVWDSGEGSNIMLSLLLHPGFIKASGQFQLSKAMALAVRDLMIALLPDLKVSIKWPNDILVSGKKICGILIENGLQGEKIEYAVCGFGININEIPPDNTRTSLKTITGIDYDLRYLEKLLFSYIEARYLQLRRNSETISKDYIDALYGYGTALRYHDMVTNKAFEGTINGIYDDGRLMVMVNGEVRLYSLKEIRLVGV